jgi:predicted SprT family Zn-dependent metalloprotease
MQSKIQAVRNKVNECINDAERTFGITMPKVDVRFDLTGRAAGMAGMRYGAFYLRFNVSHMSLGGQTWEHLLNDTVPHEVAHTVCQAFPKFGRSHNDGWKQVCVALGGNGRRCYSEEDAPEAIAAMRPYVYVTTNGNTVRVTKVIHGKIQTRGASYSYKGGKGSINRQCQFNYMTAPAVVAAKKPVVVVAKAKPVTVAKNTASKADLVRAMIANGMTEAQVVARCVSDLGMKAGLAKTYYKNNLNKV